MDFCRAHDILLEAWGPFGQGELFQNPSVQAMAQIALAWSLQEGFLPLPKSVTPSRIASNLDCFDIELSPADLEILKNISGLEGGAPNPDGMDF